MRRGERAREQVSRREQESNRACRYDLWYIGCGQKEEEGLIWIDAICVKDVEKWDR